MVVERKLFVAAYALIFFSFGIVCEAKAQGQAVNVRNEGAKCDGMTDDAPAFNNALNRADPAKNGSGEVFVPPSRTSCLLGSPLVFHSNETLYAQPDTVTIAPLLPYPNLSRNPFLVSISNVSKVTVRGLAFDGEIDRIGTSNNLIAVYSADHILFDHVTVRNARGVSIMFSGGPKGIQYSGVQNSNFSNAGTYYLKSGNKNADRKQAVAFCCGAKDSNGDWSNQHNFAQSNVWGGDGFDNLSIGQQSWFTASGNSFNGNHNGGNIYCANNSHISIVNTVGKGASGNGIDCFINDDLTITGNKSSMNGAAGIQAAGTHCGLIAKNEVLNNFQSEAQSWNEEHPGVSGSLHRGGITIGGQAKDPQGTSDVTISENVSGDDQKMPTQAYGIQVGTAQYKLGVNNLRVVDNRLFGNTINAYGLEISGPTPSATGAASCHLWAGDK